MAFAPEQFAPSGVTPAPGTPNRASLGGFLSQQPETPETHKAVTNQHTITPVTILQLVQADIDPGNGEYQLDNSGIGQVTFVGRIAKVISANEKSANYMVDDRTGRIPATHWLQENGGAAQPAEGRAVNAQESFKEGELVRIFGHLRNWEMKKNVVCFRAYQVEDWNELTFHLLQVIMHRCQRTKGLIPLKEGSTAVSTGNRPAQQAQQATPQAAASAPPQAQQQQQEGEIHLNGDQSRMYNALKEHPMSATDLYASFSDWTQDHSHAVLNEINGLGLLLQSEEGELSVSG